MRVESRKVHQLVSGGVDGHANAIAGSQSGYRVFGVVTLDIVPEQPSNLGTHSRYQARPTDIPSPVRAACRTVHGPTTLNPNGRGSDGGEDHPPGPRYGPLIL